MIPGTSVLPEKLTVPQLVRTYSAYYGTRSFIIAFTSPTPVPILSQINPVHVSKPHFLKIHFNIILLSTFGFSKWSLSLGSPHQNPIRTSPVSHTCYMLLPSHFVDLITRIMFGEQYRSSSSSLCSLLHSFVTSSVLGPNVFIRDAAPQIRILHFVFLCSYHAFIHSFIFI